MSARSFTDAIFQAVSLFIEGVQVPFNNITISSGIGGLPTATISIPVQAGLLDIARFYQPKIHIFFQDRSKTYDNENESFKTLFTGLISQVSYSKSKGLGAGSSIMFQCVHKYYPINECLIDYSGWLSPNDVANVGGGNKADNANSISAVIEALAGVQAITSDEDSNEDQVVSKNNPEGRVDVIPKEFKGNATRFLGMPGVLVNYWNQLKRASFNKSMRANSNYENEAFVKMYQPLLEDGLQFFNRLGGHLPVEFAISMNKQVGCTDSKGKDREILIPPCSQNFMKSAVQSSMTINNLQNTLQNSGELTTIYQIFSNFYNTIDYDLLTLASPAEAPIPPALDPETGTPDDAIAVQNITGSSTSPVDTVVKPRLPYYFSPTCNVLFPGMYHSINVMYDEINIPTRVDVVNPEVVDSGRVQHFRAPHSVRESIARKVVDFQGDVPYGLLSTIDTSQGAVGLYEQGRGVKMESMAFPHWLSMFSQSSLGENGVRDDKAPDKDADPEAYANLQKLKQGWANRYPGTLNEPMNPFSENAGISAHQRIIFSTADYYYTQVFARSKAGTVDCLFNPYLVPGYPMDILEKNPLYPSFHAHCTQVTHNISAEGCSTSVQFTAAMTYSELANYYIPFVNPFLQVTLNLAESSSLLYPSSAAYKTADSYYRYTLGVPSIAPTDLMDFNSGTLYPHKWDNAGDWTKGSDASIRGSNGGEMNPMLSFEGNLSLVARPIESKAKIEDRFGLKFIDMKPENYASTVIKYKDKTLDESAKFEIGQSQFLDYNFYFDTKVDAPKIDTTAPTTTEAGGQFLDSEGNVTSTGVEDGTLNNRA